MDINKIAGGNIIPQGSVEAFRKINDEVKSAETKPQENNTIKDQDKGARLDVQA